VFLVVFAGLFLTGCATSPFPKTTETGVVVQVIAKGRPMENVAIGVNIVNNTPDFIADVTVKLVSIDGNTDLKPFELWNSKQELSIKDVSKTSTIDSGKSQTFAFTVTSYSYLDPKAYPMVVEVTYKDSNGKINTITKNSILDLVPFNGFYKFMRDIIDFLKKITFNYALAIIVLTIIIKLITHPLTRVQFKSSAGMQEIAPEIKKIQEKYKDNPQKANQEVMKIYKEHNVNMFGGCLPLLVQWPLLFILFGALNNYSPFNTTSFLWLKNLNSPDPYYILPILVFVSMFLQTKTSQLPGQEMDPNTKMMMYFLPVIFAVWALKWSPSILIYWITFSLVTIGEQYIILRDIKKAVALKTNALEKPKQQNEDKKPKQ
ncbi:MAG: membrane protein insertase YidC, partial [Caldisericaceae bacterium]